MSLNAEGLRKAGLMKTLARKQYERLSILPDGVTMEDYHPNELRHQGEFVQLPYRPQLPIRDFNDPATVLDLVFGEIGRGLAFSETRYIVEQLQNSAQLQTLPNSPLQAVLAADTILRGNGFRPSLLLAPIDYYMDWYDDLIVAAGPNVPFRITAEEEKNYLMFPDGHRLRLVWSNNLAPFQDFFILDPRWARWISKPSEDGERFQISYTERGENLDVIFRLVFRLAIEDLRAIRRFTPGRGRNAR